MAQFLSPGYPASLVSAKKADRLAWTVLDAGKRNVYTAAAPDFKPVRLTSFLEDNGVDTSDPAISDDGSIVIFVRGHSLNREGYGANPTSSPDGPERAVWAVRTAGGPAWRLGPVTAPLLSPDGRWVAFVKDGQIYAYAVTRGPAPTRGREGREAARLGARAPTASPRWSPDGSKLAFVSDRADHSFIGILDVRKRTVTFVGPSVDRDTSPTWSPDGKRIAFIRRPGLPFGHAGAAGRRRHRQSDGAGVQPGAGGRARAGGGGRGGPPSPAARRGGWPGGRSARRSGERAARRRPGPLLRDAPRRLPALVPRGRRRDRRIARVLAPDARRRRRSAR